MSHWWSGLKLPSYTLFIERLAGFLSGQLGALVLSAPEPTWKPGKGG